MPEDNRNIIMWRLRTGAPWRDVPAKYGDWYSIYRRFRRWSASGIWESVPIALTETMAESGTTTSTAPQFAPMSQQRVEKGDSGRSRSGFTSKVHFIGDATVVLSPSTSRLAAAGCKAYEPLIALPSKRRIP